MSSEVSPIGISHALDGDDWAMITRNGLTWPRPSKETDYQVVLTDRSGRSAKERTLAQAIYELGYPLVGVKR